MELGINLLNLCPVPMSIIGKDDKFLFVNESFKHLIGYDVDEMPDIDHWFALAYPDEQYRKEKERLWKEASSLLEKKIDFLLPGREANVTCKDGSVRTVEIFGAKVGGENNLVILIDVTEKKKQVREKEKLINKLYMALSEVKTLRGLIPICAGCKKIRDDKGYWNNLEMYIEKYSNASFSHSVCPECADKLYGNENWYIRLKKKEDAEENSGS